MLAQGWLSGLHFTAVKTAACKWILTFTRLWASHGREPLTGLMVAELQHTRRLLQPSRRTGELYTVILTIVKSQPFPVRPTKIISTTPTWGSASGQVWQALQIPILFHIKHLLNWVHKHQEELRRDSCPDCRVAVPPRQALATVSTRPSVEV